MSKKKSNGSKINTQQWLNTYADFMTLLLCVFVMLFSMSNVDSRKFDAFIAAFTGSSGVLDNGNAILKERVMKQGSMSNGASSAVMEMQSFNDAKKEIEQYLKEKKLSNQVDVLNEDAGLLLRFKDNVLFDSGSSRLTNKSKDVLNYTSNILNSNSFKDKFISIEGHTDNVPISTAEFPSNWELSVARASNVARYLVERTGIDPKRISASGYSQYHPVKPNDSQENKAYNRRVDIMILKSKDLKNSNYLQ